MTSRTMLSQGLVNQPHPGPDAGPDAGPDHGPADRRPEMASLAAAVDRIRWWHQIDLGGGLITPGADRSARKLPRIAMPDDLSGKSVLDVGAWDGFFSFEAKRRGAERVLATDSYCWSGPGWGSKDGFELARRALGADVEDLDIDVLDLSPERVGVFDVVLMLGVLYHMVHPLRALERVASVTGDLLILETATDLVHFRRPALAFYPESEWKGDTTNWFGPNPAAVIAMLRVVGFQDIRVVYRDSPGRRFARAVKSSVHGRRQPFFTTLGQGRLVVHARRAACILARR